MEQMYCKFRAEFALAVKVGAINSHNCLIRICEQMLRKCTGLLSLFLTFATYLNLLHLHRFAQLCFLCNESSLALTTNASKHEAETSVV